MLITRKDEGLRVFLQLTPEDVQMLDEAKKQSASQGLHSSKAFKLLNIVQSQAQKLLRPYKFEITKVLWISRYTVSQRIVNTFRDHRGSEFLLGDACHTHSPTAGQGMNISISDAYNLTWKLALVMKGLASPKLLDTYETERKHIATQLINFDAKFAKAFTQRTNLDDTTLYDLWQENVNE
jgi:phenol 2-monooxygenase